MKDISRVQIVAEVLELGEMLFDTAIDAAAQRPAEEQAGDMTFLEEMRAAANEFFTLVRLLLETGQEIGALQQLSDRIVNDGRDA